MKRDSSMSYPGGKNGAGVYQRLINLIPRHRILISAFAGRCGVVRNIRPADHTIVIDADERVCQWWSNWSRGPKGRAIEIHHCDSTDWLRYRFGMTKYSDSGSSDDAGGDTADTFLFCDPPYVLSLRAHGKQYKHEMTDDDHRVLVRILTLIPASAAAVMICGYRSRLYSVLSRWRKIDHQVPTRGGLQNERIWMNYCPTDDLHDYRHIGDSRRQRERIRRRQVNWSGQLKRMSRREQLAMLAILNDVAEKRTR